ncbi:YopX family protein [Niallia circulans]|uniref:YopX family protein n=1 Tax=Niallia circulans TaxID=1397 RepID=UPI003D962F6C
MREIKFRVWDKDYSKMHICGTNTHDAINFLENQACYYNQQNGCGSLPNGEGTYDLMQYTGLKDKNGVEIYEGDVVKGHWWAYGKAHRHIGKVTYGMAAFKVVGVKQYLGNSIELDPTFEIIGNIYQNPELLERGE